MKALFLIAVHNMKKKKADVVVFLFLISLTALLFYTSISVFSGMDKVLDNAYDSANTADFFFMSNIADQQVGEILTAQEEVEQYEVSECVYFLDAEYQNTRQEEKYQSQFIFAAIEEERTIGTLVGCEEVEPAYNSILLPYYMQTTGGAAVGDTYIFTLGDKEYEFQVAGFVEDPLFSTPVNIGAYSVYISSSCMKDMLEENTIAQMCRYEQHKVRLKEGEDDIAFQKRVMPLLEALSQNGTVAFAVDWTTMKGGDGMMSRISMGIVLAFSILLIFVVLIVIRFSIHNYIELNLKNVGILQAAGYTAGQLRAAVLLEMGMIAALGAVLGILLGTAGSNLIGKFQGIMLGISWKQSFHSGAAAATFLVILVMVLMISFICGSMYKRISVLEALRGGLHTHNFKKNHFSFEKSRLAVSLVLAGKNIMNEKAKNLSILFIIAILGFSAYTGFILYDNFALTKDNLLKLTGIELGDMVISGENAEEIGHKLENWQELELVFYYNMGLIYLESGEAETTVNCDFWSQPELLVNELVVRGRLPRYENELVLTTSVAKELGVDIGDTVYVTGQGERLDYVVCGIDQKINNMGLKAMMNTEGEKRLNGYYQVSFLYVYTAENISYEEISTKILEQFPDVSIMDSEKQIGNTLSGVTMAMVAICVIFVCITVFVVIMVEILLVKSRLIRERKNLGLNKAFGYTAGQLMIQTMLLNMPMIILGAILGVIAGYFLKEKLIVVCLSFCGIEMCPLRVNFVWMVVTVVGIIAVAALTSFLSARKIRKIEPVKLLTEE